MFGEERKKERKENFTLKCGLELKNVFFIPPSVNLITYARGVSGRAPKYLRRSSSATRSKVFIFPLFNDEKSGKLSLVVGGLEEDGKLFQIGLIGAFFIIFCQQTK